MIRLVIGILFGYALFAFTAVLIFAVPGRDPHAAADPGFMVGAIGAGILGALTGGYIGAAVARGRERLAGAAIGLIIATAATISVIAQPGAGARWSAFSTLLLMSPSALLGAFIRYRRVRVR
jgi:hypothetical protein